MNLIIPLLWEKYIYLMKIDDDFYNMNLIDKLYTKYKYTYNIKIKI